MPGSSFSSISFDNEPACYELTRRLTEKGHRRIGLLVLNSPMNIGADRLAGCLRALREVGVEQDPALVRCCAAAAVDGYTQTRLMMTMPDPPTAIVCCSEELCTGAVRACMDLSLVPGRDISLVSFDELITPLAPTACWKWSPIRQNAHRARTSSRRSSTSSTALRSFKRTAFYFSGRKIIDHERISTGKS